MFVEVMNGIVYLHLHFDNKHNSGLYANKSEIFKNSISEMFVPRL